MEGLLFRRSWCCAKEVTKPWKAKARQQFRGAPLGPRKYYSHIILSLPSSTELFLSTLHVESKASIEIVGRGEGRERERSRRAIHNRQRRTASAEQRGV